MKKAKKPTKRPNKHFTFPIKKVGGTYMIDIPAKLSKRGRRERPRFKTRLDAETEAKKLRALAAIDRQTMQAVSPLLAGETLKANAILEPHGITPVRAADIFDTLTAKVSKYGKTLDEVVSDFVERMKSAEASTTMGKAIKSYFSECGASLKHSTLKCYEMVLNKHFEPLHEHNLAEIASEQLGEILSKYKSPADMTVLSSFWHWACEPQRQYAKIETLETLKPKKRRKADRKKKAKIVTLSPEEVETLLFTSWKENKAVCMSLAIAIFAGVRMEELKQLELRHITKDHIVIDESIAKTSSARHTPICPTLRAWIDACAEKREQSDKVVSSVWEAEYKRVRRLAGWDVQATRIPEKTPKPTRGTWDRNSMRHTCATVAIRTGKQIRDLEFEFGHNEGSQMLRQHYVNNLFKKADAEKILAVMPPKTKAAKGAKSA
jgi:integrase